MSGPNQLLALNQAASLLEAGIPAARALVPLNSLPSELLLSRELQTLVSLSEETGTSLAAGLRFLGKKTELIAKAEAEIKAAVTVPGATAKLMVWLPVAMILGNLSLGLIAIEDLVANPLLIAVLVVGALLLFTAGKLSRRLIHAAQLKPAAYINEFVTAELMLKAGVPHPEVLRRVSVSDPTDAATNGQTGNSVRLIFELADSYGASPARVLEAQLLSELESFQYSARQKAEQLSVRIVLPIGLIGLPGFLLLALAPAIFSITKS